MHRRDFARVQFPAVDGAYNSLPLWTMRGRPNSGQAA
jgi:hypothetical protein